MTSLTEDPQIIRPENLGIPSLSGFGYSISQVQEDVDDNGYPDFVVGAPDSDEAILLRTKEVVSFTPASWVDYPRSAVDPKRESRS